LSDYSAKIGQANFSWEALPVATDLDAFDWTNEGNVLSVRPQLTEPERDHYLAEFMTRLEQYCGK